MDILDSVSPLLASATSSRRSMTNSGSTRREPNWADGPPPTLSWRSWPLRDHLPGTLVVAAVLAGVAFGVRWVTGQPHLALLASGALAVALWRFFLPILFELGPDGVDHWLLGRRRRVPWTAIQRYEVRSTGVLLLPFADRCEVDALRGLYLPWGEHRDEVLFQVRYYLDRAH